MSQEERVAWYEDWCEDVEDLGVPYDLLMKAVKLWRRGTNPFLPTFGQFYAQISQELSVRKALHARAVDVLGESA